MAGSSSVANLAYSDTLLTDDDIFGVPASQTSAPTALLSDADIFGPEPAPAADLIPQTPAAPTLADDDLWPTALGRAAQRGTLNVEAAPGMIAAGVNARVAGDAGKSLSDITAEIVAQTGASSPAGREMARTEARQRFDLAQTIPPEQAIEAGAAGLLKSSQLRARSQKIPMSAGAQAFRDDTWQNAPATLGGIIGAFAADPVGGAAFLGETAAEFAPVIGAAAATTALTKSPAVGIAVMGAGDFMVEASSSAADFLAEKKITVTTPAQAEAVLRNAPLMREAEQRGLTRGLVISMMDMVSGGVAGKVLMKSKVGDLVAQTVLQAAAGSAGEYGAEVASGQPTNLKDIAVEGLAEAVTAPAEVLGVARDSLRGKPALEATDRSLPKTPPSNPQAPRPDLPVTPDQIASPIPTQTLQVGTEIVRKAIAGESLDDVPGLEDKKSSLPEARDEGEGTAPATNTTVSSNGPGVAGPVPPADHALLLGAGWSPEDVADMSPDERAAEVQVAIEQGVTPPAPVDAPAVPALNEPSVEAVPVATDLPEQTQGSPVSESASPDDAGESGAGLPAPPIPDVAQPAPTALTPATAAPREAGTAVAAADLGDLSSAAAKIAELRQHIKEVRADAKANPLNTGEKQLDAVPSIEADLLEIKLDAFVKQSAFLKERGLTVDQARALPPKELAKLNADYAKYDHLGDLSARTTVRPAPTFDDLVPASDQSDTKAWLKSRDDTIIASRKAGGRHLDQIEGGPTVENLRGKRVYSVHDPKEVGIVRTVSNDGDVVVNWSDDYSAQKNLATEVQQGKKTVKQSWLAPTDLKDYAIGAPAAAQGRAQTAETPPAATPVAGAVDAAPPAAERVSKAKPKGPVPLSTTMADTPGRDFQMRNARYAKDKVLLTSPSDGSGNKTRAMRLADGLGGKWTNREKGYIMTRAAAAKFARAYEAGKDFDVMTRRVYDPAEEAKAIEAGAPLPSEEKTAMDFAEHVISPKPAAPAPLPKAVKGPKLAPIHKKPDISWWGKRSEDERREIALTAGISDALGKDWRDLDEDARTELKAARDKVDVNAGRKAAPVPTPEPEVKKPGAKPAPEPKAETPPETAPKQELGGLSNSIHRDMAARAREEKADESLQKSVLPLGVASGGTPKAMLEWAPDAAFETPEHSGNSHIFLKKGTVPKFDEVVAETTNKREGISADAPKKLMAEAKKGQREIDWRFTTQARRRGYHEKWDQTAVVGKVGNRWVSIAPKALHFIQRHNLDVLATDSDVLMAIVNRKGETVGVVAGMRPPHDPSHLEAQDKIAAERKSPKSVGDPENRGDLFDGKSKFARTRSTPLYSATLRAAEAISQEKGNGLQFLAMLRKTPGVKEEELNWLGLPQWLGERKGVTKAEVVEYIRANQVQIKETTLGNPNAPVSQADIDAAEARGDWDEAERLTRVFEDQELGSNANDTGNETKFASYTLPGGENYRELLISMPSRRYMLKKLGSGRYAVRDIEQNQFIRDAGGMGRSFATEADARAEINHLVNIGRGDTAEYHSSHFDEPNILAHIRFNERTVDLPFTAEEEAAIARRAELKSEDDRLYAELGKAIHASMLEGRDYDAKRRDAILERAKAGEITLGEANRLMNTIEDRPETPAMRRQRAIDAQRQALKMPAEPRRKKQRVLFIEEIQSDWHQAGRRKGYAGQVSWKVEPQDGGTWKIVWNDGTFSGGYGSEETANNTAELNAKARTVPDAPLKSTWHETAFRRAVAWATENGFDSVAWTPGEMQAERYDLSKQLDKVTYDPENSILDAFKDGTVVMSKEVDPKDLPDHIGKDVAQKLLDQPITHLRVYSDGRPPAKPRHVLSGLDLKVGGEGMKGFYDRILPSYAKKWGKRFGADVGTTQMESGTSVRARRYMRAADRWQDVAAAESRERLMQVLRAQRQLEPDGSFDGEIYSNGPEVWSMPITPAMRETVQKEGVALFKRGPASPQVVTAGGVTFETSPLAMAKAADIIHDLRAALGRMAPGVDLGVVQRMFAGGGEVAGLFNEDTAGRQMVVVALEASGRDPGQVLGHEALHAVWGLLRPAEQVALTKAARADRKAMIRAANEYPDLSEAEQIEEVIADHFGDWHAGNREATGFVRSAFERIAAFLKALGSALRGNGFTTAESVYKRIEGGKVGTREGGASARTAEARGRDVTKTDAFRRWFGKSAVVDADGEPLVMYHGTSSSEAISEFRVPGDDTFKLSGIWFTPSKRYAGLYTSNKNVVEAYLRMERPLDLTDKKVRTEWVKGNDGVTPVEQRAKAAGYDGIIFTDKEYVVFDATQVKSTDNTGAFSPLDPRIRYAKARPAALNPPNQASGPQRLEDYAVVVPKTSGLLGKIAEYIGGQQGRHSDQGWRNRAFQDLEQQFFNRFGPVRNLERRVSGGRLAPGWDSPYKALEMATNDSGRNAALLHRGAFKFDADGVPVINGDTNGILPILDIATGGSDVSRAERGKRLYAFEEYMLARRGAELQARGFETPMTEATIKANLAKHGQNPDFIKAAAEWKKFNDANVDFLVASGRIGKEAGAALKSDAAYIPFYRSDERMAEASPELDLPAVFTPSGPVNRREILAGRNPGIKKMVGGKTLKLDDMVHNMIRNAQAMTAAAARNVAANKSFRLMSDAGLVKLVRSETSPHDNAVQLWMNGRPYWAVPTDAAAGPYLTALGALQPVQLSAVSQFMAQISNVFRTGITSTPPFMLRNLIRGTVSTAVHSSGANLRLTNNALTGLVSSLRNSPAQQYFSETSGMGDFRFGGHDMGAGRNDILIDYGLAPKTFGSVLRQGVDALEKVGMATEMADRLALQETLINNGVRPDEAAYQALTVMNYGRRGANHALRSYLPLIPFLNARLQGLSRLSEGAIGSKGEKGSRKAALAQMALNGSLLMLAGLAIHAWNNDDDDRRKKYEAEPIERRLNYHIIYAGDKKILIPKAFEVGALFNSLPEFLYNAVVKGDSSELGQAAAQTVLNTLSFNPIPQAIVPTLETAINYDFFTGRPIEGLREENLKPEDRYTQNTGDLAVLLGKHLGLSDLTGMGPERLDHLLSGYGGLAYTALNAAVDVAATETGLLPQRAGGAFGDVPAASSVAQNALGSMFRDADADASNKWVGEFYDLKDAATQVYRSAKQAEDNGNMQAAEEIAAEMPGNHPVYTAVNATSAVLTRINKQIRLINGSDVRSAASKRLALKPLVRDRNLISTMTYQKALAIQKAAERGDEFKVRVLTAEIKMSLAEVKKKYPAD